MLTIDLKCIVSNMGYRGRQIYYPAMFSVVKKQSVHQQMAAMNWTTSALPLKHYVCKCPFLPQGGNNSPLKSSPPIVPTAFADFQRYIELLELLSMGKCFGNHNAEVLLQWWHAVTPDELAHVNSSSDTGLCSSRRSRGFLAFVYTALSWEGGGVLRLWIKRRTMMTCEKWFIPVPRLCVIEQVAAVLPGQWDYQSGGLEGWEMEGWWEQRRVAVLSIMLSGHAADIKPLHRYGFEIQEA